MNTNMDFDKIIKEELILTDFKAKNRKELFLKVSEFLEKENIVKDSFYNALLEREEQFPTGLNTQPYNLAIPHTDSKHVNKSRVVIVKLTNPVNFKQMDNPDKNLNVEIVFFLLIHEKENQTRFLSKIISSLQDKNFLNEIKLSNDPKRLRKVINSFLTNI